MRNFSLFFSSALLCIGLIATGCGGKKQDSKTAGAVSLPSDYKSYDLKDKGIELAISAPPAAEIYTYTLVTNDGKQDAVALQLASDGKDRLNISVTSDKFDARKEKAEKDIFREFKSKLAEDKNALLYEYNDKDKGTGYGIIRIVEKGGKAYLIESDNMMSPIKDKAKAELLFNIARSAQ